jgi:hypothetical protein
MSLPGTILGGLCGCFYGYTKNIEIHICDNSTLDIVTMESNVSKKLVVIYGTIGSIIGTYTFLTVPLYIINKLNRYYNNTNAHIIESVKDVPNINNLIKDVICVPRKSTKYDMSTSSESTDSLHKKLIDFDKFDVVKDEHLENDYHSDVSIDEPIEDYNLSNKADLNIYSFVIKKLEHITNSTKNIVYSNESNHDCNQADFIVVPKN